MIYLGYFLILSAVSNLYVYSTGGRPVSFIAAIVAGGLALVIFKSTGSEFCIGVPL